MQTYFSTWGAVDAHIPRKLTAVVERAREAAGWRSPTPAGHAEFGQAVQPASAL